MHIVMWHERLLYEAIAIKARELRPANATALHGIIGCDASGKPLTAKVLRLNEDSPFVIRIVDA